MSCRRGANCLSRSLYVCSQVQDSTEG